jgi:hypothetical protein
MMGTTVSTKPSSTIQIVYGSVSDELKGAIRRLWLTDGSVPEPEATNRLGNVVAVRLRDGNVISVCTVKVGELGPFGLFYFFSTTAAKSERRRTIPKRDNLLRATIDFLRDLPADPKPKGVVALLENKRISPKAAGKLGGMSYLGTTPNGNHVMYVNFDGSFLTHDAESKPD